MSTLPDPLSLLPVPEHAPPTSAGDLSLEDMSSEWVTTDRVMQWPGLLLRNCHAVAPEAGGSIPPMTEDNLFVGLGGIVRAKARTSRSYDEVLQQGMIILLPRGTPAVQHNQGYCELAVLTLYPSFLGDLALESMEIDPTRAELEEKYGVWDPMAVQVVGALLNLRNAANPSDSLFAESLIRTLGYHTLRSYGTFPRRPDRISGRLSPNVVRRVSEYVDLHPGDHLTLADLSKVANLSPFHFAILFKATTGQTVHRYVLQRRIEAARRLLFAGDLSLAEIAHATGFADQSHFTRTFKRIVGITPGSLRKHRMIIQNPRKNLQDADS
jgi:AraC family transcriptional regulator